MANPDHLKTLRQGVDAWNAWKTPDIFPNLSGADLGALQDVAFDKVVYIIGNTDHHNLEKETLPRGEPTAFDYHLLPLV